MNSKLSSVSNIKNYIIKNVEDPLYKNSYFLMLNTVLASIFGFVFWTIAARIYSTSDVGLAATMISAINLLTLFSNLGFSAALVRFLPTYNERMSKDMINTCFTVTTISSVILASLFIAEIKLFFPNLAFIHEDWELILSFIMFTIFSSINTLQFSVFVGMRVAKYELIKNLIWNILKIPFLVLFLWLGAFGILSSFGVALIIAVLFGTFVLIPKVLLGYSVVPTVNRKIIYNSVHFSAGNYIADILMTSPNYLLPIILTNMLDPSATAYFYIAWMIAGVVMVIPIAVSNSLFAEGSYNERKLYDNLRKSLRLVFFLTIPAIFFTILLSDKILLIFGRGYSENATKLLWLLVLSCIPYSLNRMYITLKRVEKKIGSIIAVNAATIVLGLGLVYLFVDMKGLIGVGIGWILGQGIVMVGIILALYKEHKQFNAKI